MSGLEALEKLENDECYTDYDYRVAYDVIRKELKALIHIKETLNLKVYKNKLGQCFLEGTNILIAISQEKYDLLKEVLL